MKIEYFSTYYKCTLRALTNDSFIHVKAQILQSPPTFYKTFAAAFAISHKKPSPKLAENSPPFQSSRRVPHAKRPKQRKSETEAKVKKQSAHSHGPEAALVEEGREVVERLDGRDGQGAEQQRGHERQRGQEQVLQLGQPEGRGAAGLSGRRRRGHGRPGRGRRRGLARSVT